MQAAGLSDAASDATNPAGLLRSPSRIQGTQRGQLVPLPGSKSAGLLPKRHGQLPTEVQPTHYAQPNRRDTKPPPPPRQPQPLPPPPIQPTLPPHSQNLGFDMRLLRLGLRHKKMKTDLASLGGVLNRRETEGARRLDKPISEHLLWRSM